VPRYGEAAQKVVERTMRKRKHGTLQSGHGGKKVTDPEQAIAIGLEEARRKGAKVPPRGSRSTRAGRARRSGTRTSMSRRTAQRT
jgi:hypothetical protein